MRHFLAYGNSDQESFRAPAVRNAFDYLTVPGTIAAYYPDATAAFVLSSALEYVVDPRTPLFQGEISAPKASHYSLAHWHGQSVSDRMGDDKVRSPVDFTSAFYTPEVIAQLVGEVISQQRRYGNRAAGIQNQLGRYQRLLSTAQGRPVGEPIAQGSAPSFILAPYFVTNGADPWAGINQVIWRQVSLIDHPGSISPVVAVSGVDVLRPTLDQLPDTLAQTAFFWVQRFEERSVDRNQLTAMWDTIAAQPGTTQLVNLYGGFYSICLSYAGLWGFNSGLGYSESRDWPDLPVTGAAPARYYLPRLHAFVSPGLAQLIVRTAATFECSCEVCLGRAIVGLSYHDLKRHFALVRKQELDFVQAHPAGAVVVELRAAAADYEQNVAPNVPAGAGRVNTQYLHRWADVIESRS